MNHSKKKSEQENPVNFPKVEEIRMMISTYNKTANQLQNFYLVPSYMGLLNVGRKESGKQAITVLEIDGEVSNDVISKIAKVEGVRENE